MLRIRLALCFECVITFEIFSEDGFSDSSDSSDDNSTLEETAANKAIGDNIGIRTRLRVPIFDISTDSEDHAMTDFEHELTEPETEPVLFLKLSLSNPSF